MIFSEKEVLERTFTMKAEIHRNESYTTDYHETKTGWVIKYPSMPCTIQRSTRRNTDQTTSTNDINYDTVLIHSPDYTTKAGDKVKVTYPNGVSFDFEAGEPYYFETHYELPLIRDGEA